jgi:hypothetical protein
MLFDGARRRRQGREKARVTRTKRHAAAAAAAGTIAAVGEGQRRITLPRGGLSRSESGWLRAGWEGDLVFPAVPGCIVIFSCGGLMLIGGCGLWLAGRRSLGCLQGGCRWRMSRTYPALQGY